MIAISQPLPLYFDSTGTPLDNGYLYFGEVNENPETNPIVLYWDVAGTQPVAQPVRTMNGYAIRSGSPAVMYAAGQYSLTVKSSNGSLLYYAPDATIANSSYLLRADLASTSSASLGAGMVGFNSTLTYPPNTVGENLSRIANLPVNVKDFGAKGDGVTDDTASIQAAIDSLGLFGGSIFFPVGTYLVSKNAAGNYCLKITCPFVIFGEGYFSVIKPAATVANTVDILYFQPNPGIDCSNSSVQEVFIGDPGTGTRYGQHAIAIDTQAALTIPLTNIIVTRVQTGQGPLATCKSVYHINNAAANINGGMFGSSISENVFRGGISLNDSGDSIVIERNVISGTGTGVYASTVPGASQLTIHENNITTVDCAILIDNARRVSIMRNNIEQTTAGATGSAMVFLRGSNGTIISSWIAYNNLGAFTGTGILYNVRIGNANIGSIWSNQCLPASASTYAIALFATANNYRVWGNQNYLLGSTLRVMDGGGLNTAGVRRVPTLLNSWVPYDPAFADVYYIKDSEGYVTVQGQIKNGTAVNPTILFNLPAGYRPEKSEFFAVYSQDSVPTVVPGAILVSSGSGNVIFTAGNNALLSVSCRFLASDLGWDNSDL